MEQTPQVLFLTKEPTIQNLIEQICRIDGHTPAAASTLQDVYAFLMRDGGAAFTLAVVDAAALGMGDAQQRLAHQLWSDWQAAYPGAPLMLVGAPPPSDGVPANPSDVGGFLDKPFGPNQLADMMRTFLPGP